MRHHANIENGFMKYTEVDSGQGKQSMKIHDFFRRGIEKNG